MIPRILHYIYLKGKDTPDLNFTHYLCIKSNLIQINPDQCILWTNDPKYVNNLTLIQTLRLKYKQFRVEKTDLIETYNDHQITRLSHQADILKLQLLIKFGGVYSDLDSMAVRKLPEDFFNYAIPIFCSENIHDINPSALCNGFFMSPQNSEMINLMLNEYDNYYPDCEFGEFAVTRPWNIYMNNKHLIKLLSAQAFQPFYLDYNDILSLYFLDNQNKLTNDVYQVHLWENRNKTIIKMLNYLYYEKCESTLAILGRSYLE